MMYGAVAPLTLFLIVTSACALVESTTWVSPTSGSALIAPVDALYA